MSSDINRRIDPRRLSVTIITKIDEYIKFFTKFRTAAQSNITPNL